MPLILNHAERNRFPRGVAIPPRIDSNEQQPQAPESSSTADHIFDPTPRDISHVRQILTKKGRLPPEVIDIIMDDAEYWVCTNTAADYSSLQAGHLTVCGGQNFRENQFLVRALSINRALLHRGF